MITFSPISIRASMVADPMWGSSTTLLSRASFISLRSTAGSSSKTSSPAPAMRSCSISFTSAFSSMISPRAVLTMKAWGWISASRRADRR